MKDEKRHPLFWVLAVLVPINLYVIFFYAPIEKTMGVVQKVFYFHVASAWIGLLAFCVVFGASILYLWKRQDRVNHLALASAEIGTVFITGTLLTGPLWAYPIWNTWWTWDPRLTTTAVLWFMYVAYMALQSGGATEARKRLAAVYGIIAFINVPLVFFFGQVVAIHSPHCGHQCRHWFGRKNAGGLIFESSGLFTFIRVLGAFTDEVHCS